MIVVVDVIVAVAQGGLADFHSGGHAQHEVVLHGHSPLDGLSSLIPHGEADVLVLARNGGHGSDAVNDVLAKVTLEGVHLDVLGVQVVADVSVDPGLVMELEVLMDE